MKLLATVASDSRPGWRTTELFTSKKSPKSVQDVAAHHQGRKTEVKNRWGIDLPDGLVKTPKRAIKDYQDYMIVHVAQFASEKDVPLLVHTGGAMSPSIDMRNANPLSLFSLFYNPVVRKNLPRIVMLHTGYPFHEIAAAIVSEFPNAFIDLSFFTGLRGVTEKVLRSFIELVPHQKILYGSDSSTVPERLGWCATNIGNL